MLTSKLGDAIRADRRCTTIVANRRPAVERRARGVDHPVSSDTERLFVDALSQFDVASAVVSEAKAPRVLHAGPTSEVDDEIVGTQHIADDIEGISLDEREAFMDTGCGKVCPLASRQVPGVEVVDADDLGAKGQQLLDDGGPDEPSGTRDDDSMLSDAGCRYIEVASGH